MRRGRELAVRANAQALFLDAAAPMPFRISGAEGACRKVADAMLDEYTVLAYISPVSFETLNDRQREAASFSKGPLLILAGAGTGKTTPSPTASRTCCSRARAGARAAPHLLAARPRWR